MNIYYLFSRLNQSVISEFPIYEGDLTYYELRKFITLLFRTVKNADTKKILADILKALAVLEIKNMPVPTIKKLKSISPKIFS
jgi:hypothetical protein